MYENRRYLIIPTTITGSINFNEVGETSIDTLRLSVDGRKTFVKYTVHIEEEDRIETHTDVETGDEITTEITAGIYGRPSIYDEAYTEYTHEQILTILSTEEWTSTMEEL
jgi:hypothetical protein